MSALAPAILKKGLLAPAILGQIIAVSTRNSKVLNRPMRYLVALPYFYLCTLGLCSKNTQKSKFAFIAKFYLHRSLSWKCDNGYRLACTF